MRRYLLYFLLFCNFIFFVSCKKDKFKAPKASFLVIDDVILKTTTVQGVNSHKITDMWYYVNGEFKGVFPIGGVMPIVASDNAEITLFAGIKNNGISFTRLPYAIYDSKTFNMAIEPGKTYTLSPQFEYNSTAFFYYADNFDGGSGSGSYFIAPQIAGDSSYTYTTDPAKAFGGIGKSIFMSMSDAKPKSMMLQNSGYYLPASGSVIYVELDYKCNQSVSVGVIGAGVDHRGAVTLNPSDNWNHVYVQLTSIVSTPPSYSSYQVYIEAYKEVSTPEIYIDNVKLIYQ